MWARGARRGSFEFAHKRIRSALYQEVNPLRRQAMHEHTAAAIEDLWGERYPERLSHHWSEAGRWERALPLLLRSAARATEALAPDVAAFYFGRALAALDQLAAGARTDEEAARWRAERLRVDSLQRESAPLSVV
jgi:predicted ATPase